MSHTPAAQRRPTAQRAPPAAKRTPAALTTSVVLRGANSANVPQYRSTRSHPLYPAPARSRAMALVLIGHELSKRFANDHPCGAFLDAWLTHVLPLAVDRDTRERTPPKFKRREGKDAAAAAC